MFFTLLILALAWGAYAAITMPDMKSKLKLTAVGWVMFLICFLLGRCSV